MVEFYEALHAEKDALVARYCTQDMGRRIPGILAKIKVVESKKNEEFG